eukprot:GEMP01014698.1.p1 GENE.GEMP01014698.1~~GEMP01014698.1.p1  ORF type:complete len:602 (+),score=104.65 GEMP01014698.1:172-1977(+)
MISSRTGTRDSTRSRTNATAPSKEDLHVWGNIADPPMMRESPVTSTLLIVALVAISLTSLLFGLLAYAGPWCSCGRKCPVPTSLPNAVMPLCHNETELDHGKMCDLECNIGYTPSTGRFLCVDGGLSPPSAECAPSASGPEFTILGDMLSVVVATRPSVSEETESGEQPFSHQFSREGGGEDSLASDFSYGCDLNKAQLVVGNCFNECTADQTTQPDDNYNVWAISGVRTKNGWRPPNLECCKTLFRSCESVNARIKYRQFVALSAYSGVCNLACVKLPPDAINYAMEVAPRETQGPAETVAPVAVPTTTPDPTILLAQQMAIISGGGEALTTTPPPINQTKYWLEYEANRTTGVVRGDESSALLNIVSPECFAGALLSPICVIFLVLFFACSLGGLCACICMCRHSAQEQWPSNVHHVGQQMFDECSKNIEPYRVTEVKSSAPGSKPQKKTSAVRRSAAHSVQGFGAETRVAPSAYAPKGPVPPLASFKVEDLKEESSRQLNSEAGEQEDVEAFGYFGSTKPLNCNKEHGLVIKHDEGLLCSKCNYGVVRYVPYKQQLEVVDFYCCKTCKFTLCHLCAGYTYSRVHLRGQGIVGIAKEED